MSPSEPPVKRTVVFIDGQNLFHAAREGFGYTYPNYDIHALARGDYDVALVLSQDQDLSEVADEIRTIAKRPAVDVDALPN